MCIFNNKTQSIAQRYTWAIDWVLMQYGINLLFLSTNHPSETNNNLEESWLLCLVFLVSRDGCVALPRGAMGLSAFCDCGISWSNSLTFFRNSNLKSIIF